MDIYMYQRGCRSWKPHQNFEPILPPVSVAIVQRQMDSKSAGIGATGKDDPNKTCRPGDLGKENELKHIWPGEFHARISCVSAQVIHLR